MDEETVLRVAPWHLPAYRGLSAWRVGRISRDHNGIGLWMCGTGGECLHVIGALSCPPRISACRKTKDLCSTVTYRIAATLPATYSKRTEDETPYRRERTTQRENKGDWFPKTSGRDARSNNAETQKGSLAAAGLGGRSGRSALAGPGIVFYQHNGKACRD